MTGMNIQERYDDIARISGFSEDVIRRIFKATRQSLAESLKKGERATLPGICTVMPEVRYKLDCGGETMSSYIKLKASASSALETELAKIQNFKSEEYENNRKAEEDSRVAQLTTMESNFRLNGGLDSNIRVSQISALL